jgi:hypothetical protein
VNAAPIWDDRAVSSSPSGIVEFLYIQLAEDERVARNCAVRSSDRKLHLRNDDTITIAAQRVVAEVEVKRGIVDKFKELDDEPARLAADEKLQARWQALHEVLIALALPYRGHTDGHGL